jgi:hypothetical protein
MVRQMLMKRSGVCQPCTQVLIAAAAKRLRLTHATSCHRPHTQGRDYGASVNMCIFPVVRRVKDDPQRMVMRTMRIADATPMFAFGNRLNARQVYLIGMGGSGASRRKLTRL